MESYVLVLKLLSKFLSLFLDKVQVWCRLVQALRDFIWYFTFFRCACQVTSCFACTFEILHNGFWSLIKSTFIESCVAHKFWVSNVNVIPYDH